MVFSLLTKKLLIISLLGGSFGGATYFGINNFSKGKNIQKLQIKEDKRSLKIDTKNIPSHLIKRQLKESSKGVRTLVKYVLVNEGLKACEMWLSGWKKDSIVECDFLWAKDFENSLNGKNGWVIEGDKISINSVINGWGWISQGLVAKGLKNPWIIKKDKSLSLSPQCKRDEFQKSNVQVKIVCTNTTSKK